MPQAKTLTEKDLKKLLNYISTQPHSARNRAMLLTGIYTGMRCKEIASLTLDDVWTTDSGIRHEIRLDKEQTKGMQARTVFVPQKLRKELIAYIAHIDRSDTTKALFYTQKRNSGFTANTLAQHFHYLTKRAGLEGASSHSMRRTYITNLAANGVGVRVIMGLSGHKALSSVQCYIDCNDDQKRRAVELL
jgi:integrase/recombinase XerD